MDRNEVIAVVGTCHLVDDPGDWPPRKSDSTAHIFKDEDLGIISLTCRCGVRYLRVSRRVRRGMWTFLIPVTPPEIDALVTRIGRADAETGRPWDVAEAEIVRLTSARPYLQRTDDPPAFLGWCAPGTPLAFTVAPW